MLIHRRDGTLHRFDVETAKSSPLLDGVKIVPYTDKDPYPYGFQQIQIAPDGRTMSRSTTTCGR